MGAHDRTPRNQAHEAREVYADADRKV
jgi:hypothetical protein